MQTITIGGKEFAGMLSGGAFKLAAYRQDINDLNVFPIPDGDTGDNMLMTLGSGADAAKKAVFPKCHCLCGNTAANGWIFDV